jgi:hypothetical protein
MTMPKSRKETLEVAFLIFTPNCLFINFFRQ